MLFQTTVVHLLSSSNEVLSVLTFSVMFPQGGRFPIKWMAIESLLDGVSTSKSDV